MKVITVNQFIDDVLQYFDNGDPKSIAGIADSEYLKEKVSQLMLWHKKNYAEIIELCNKALEEK